MLLLFFKSIRYKMQIKKYILREHGKCAPASLPLISKFKHFSIITLSIFIDCNYLSTVFQIMRRFLIFYLFFQVKDLILYSHT